MFAYVKLTKKILVGIFYEYLNSNWFSFYLYQLYQCSKMQIYYSLQKSLYTKTDKASI